MGHIFNIELLNYQRVYLRHHITIAIFINFIIILFIVVILSTLACSSGLPK
jgi:hypothetical protein